MLSRDKEAVTAVEPGWRFDNSYARLPAVFFTRQQPVPVKAPKLVILNEALAATLGLDFSTLSGSELAALFSGNAVPAGAEPLAQAYAGHQYGHFTMLGDGRAIVLGEHVAPDGRRFDIQFKGSGRTPYSRAGDGRAALGPMLREYIISEAMFALGVPTTRSLAVVATGEAVRRETLLPGAVLTRIAASHIRTGTFEYAAAQGGGEMVQALADHVIARHYPDVATADEPYLALLKAIAERHAALVARWLHIGFVHGVMNTDNMAVAGETIDYGPCAFMDAYDPGTVFSSIDHHGRYAFANQPRIAQWNLARLAETLLPLLPGDPEEAVQLAEDVVVSFSGRFERHWFAGMREKLGLAKDEPGDVALVTALLDWMRQEGADYTNTFRALSTGQLPDEDIYRGRGFADWHTRWQQRLAREADPQTATARMRAVNPARIPRNHQVEKALTAASDEMDLIPLHDLLAALAHPFEDDPRFAAYTAPATGDERVLHTFCGT